MDAKTVGSILGSVFGGGVALAILQPFTARLVEKQRGREAARREAIARWRLDVMAYDWDDQEKYFGDLSTYSELRDHLTAEERREFESGRMIVLPAPGRGEDNQRHVILDAITRVEKKWGLI